MAFTVCEGKAVTGTAVERAVRCKRNGRRSVSRTGVLVSSPIRRLDEFVDPAPRLAMEPAAVIPVEEVPMLAVKPSAGPTAVLVSDKVCVGDGAPTRALRTIGLGVAALAEARPPTEPVTISASTGVDCEGRAKSPSPPGARAVGGQENLDIRGDGSRGGGVQGYFQRRRVEAPAARLSIDPAPERSEAPCH